LLGMMSHSVPRVPCRILQGDECATRCKPLRCVLEKGHVVGNVMKNGDKHQKRVIAVNITQRALRVVESFKPRVSTESTLEFLD
jgi:hypothetical protein